MAQTYVVGDIINNNATGFTYAVAVRYIPEVGRTDKVKVTYVLDAKPLVGTNPSDEEIATELRRIGKQYDTTYDIVTPTDIASYTLTDTAIVSRVAQVRADMRVYNPLV